MFWMQQIYQKKNTFMLYFNCIVTITLILRTVTFNHHKKLLIICGISNTQFETKAANAKESFPKMANS
jgi:hypothetical protein